MAEYIEREAAIMTAMNYDGNGTAQDASQDIAAALGCIPAADVVEVVRCKDCKYCKVECGNYCCYVDDYLKMPTPHYGDFYCAYGERRVNDGCDEYIKREAVIELLEEKQRAICPVGRCGHGYVYGRDRDEYDAIESDIDTVRNIPAADVRPVVRGQWVHGEYGPYCSNCDGYPPTRKRSGHPGDTEFDYTKFCPNCGADMREVDDEN